MSRILIMFTLMALLCSPVLETSASTSMQSALATSSQEAREGNQSDGGHLDTAKKRKHKKKGKNGKKNRNDKNRNKNKSKNKSNTCFGQKATIQSIGTEVVDGTPDADVIIGDASDNDISGLGGEDRICSGEGNDLVNSSSTVSFGDPMLVDAGAGNDIVFGDDGDDTLRGEDGDDDLSAGDGNDVLSGGDGDDTINTNDGLEDIVDCGPGDDTVTLDVGLDDASNCQTEIPGAS